MSVTDDGVFFEVWRMEDGKRIGLLRGSPFPTRERALLWALAATG